MTGSREASLIIISRNTHIDTHEAQIAKNSLYIDRITPEKNSEKTFFTHLQQSIVNVRNNSKLREKTTYIDEFSQVDYKNAPGYSTFHKRLQEGDVLSYLAFKSVLSPMTYTTKSLDEILKEENVLMESLKTMDQKRYDLVSALLAFRTYIPGYYNMKIDQEFNDRLTKYRQIITGHPTLENYFKDIICFLFFDYNNANAVKNFQKVSGTLRAAAQKGNMEAMYLWLTRGITSLDHFSREDWEEIDKYRKILLQAGYAPYLQTFVDKNETLDINLFKSIYPDSTYQAISKRCQEVLKARN